MPFARTTACGRLIHDVLIHEVGQEIVPQLIGQPSRLRAASEERTAPSRVRRPKKRECRGLSLDVENHLLQRATETPEVCTHSAARTASLFWTIAWSLSKDELEIPVDEKRVDLASIQIF